jgi:hypothetical protein
MNKVIIIEYGTRFVLPFYVSLLTLPILLNE